MGIAEKVAQLFDLGSVAQKRLNAVKALSGGILTHEPWIAFCASYGPAQFVYGEAFSQSGLDALTALVIKLCGRVVMFLLPVSENQSYRVGLRLLLNNRIGIWFSTLVPSGDYRG